MFTTNWPFPEDSDLEVFDEGTVFAWKGKMWEFNNRTGKFVCRGMAPEVGPQKKPMKAMKATKAMTAMSRAKKPMKAMKAIVFTFSKVLLHSSKDFYIF